MLQGISFIANWLPAARWLRTYPAAGFRIDLIAGLSLAAFVIPESLAYASLAQLPPVTGLYCYLVAGIAYALFGTSRQLAVGPTSALAIVVAAAIAATMGGDPARAVALASAIALMVGLISVGGRYLGLANAAYFISDPVLVGFKTGAAFYIASTQLPKLFGVEGVSGNFFERVFHVVVSLPHTHLASCAIGFAAIASFVALNRLLPGRPTTLIVVVAAIAVVTVSGLGEAGVKIVGEIPRGLPPIGLPHIHVADITELIPHRIRLFHTCLWRGDLRRAQFRAKARLRHRSRAGTHSPWRLQYRHRIGPRVSGRGRDVANGGKRHGRRLVITRLGRYLRRDSDDADILCRAVP